ncbi:MAG: hypothetical protein WAT39_04645 [Planctomycetota bacterium]
MRLPLLTAAFAALCLTLPATAQKIQGADANSMRNETRIMVYTEDFSVFAMASLTHGQPEWKAEYDGKFDSLKGKTNRLGKDWFTTLITSSEFEIGGTRLAAGSYVVGLHCDKDGKFSLAFMDSSKAMKDGVNPFMDWKPEVSAALTLNKDSAKESVVKMTMTFAAEKGGAGKGTFTLAWGKHTLTAPCQLHAPKK